jgi:hypothetical protein
MALELKLAAGKTFGALEGEISTAPLDRPRQVGVAPAFGGTIKVTGTYNALAKAFALHANPSAAGSHVAMRRLSLLGVLDGSSMTLAGVRAEAVPGDSSPFFVLVREADSAGLLRRVRASVDPGGLPSGNAPSEAKLIQWASRLRSEYPELDPQRAPMRDVYWRARNLFEDAHFENYFNETYDEMSQGRRKAAHGMLEWGQEPNPLEALRKSRGPVDDLRRTAALEKKRRSSKLVQSYSVLDAPFRTAGTFSAADMTVSVFAQRSLRAWLSQTIAAMTSQAPTPEAFRKLDAIESARKTIATLWPSEQARFGTALDAARSRLADATLPLLAKKITSDAEGLSGVLELAGFEKTEARLLSWASANSRSIALDEVNRKLDELLESLINEDLKSFEVIGQSEGAVVAGARWLTGVWTRYGEARKRPAVEKAVAKLQARRASDLNAEKDRILEVIASQRDQEGVRSVLNVALAVPGDAQTPAGKLIAEQGQKRLREIGSPNDWLVALFVVGIGALLFDAVLSPSDPYEPPPRSSQASHSGSLDQAVLHDMLEEDRREKERRREYERARREAEARRQQAENLRRQQEYMRQQLSRSLRR